MVVLYDNINVAVF